MGPGISRITHVEVDLRRSAIWAADAVLCAGLALPGPAASAITVPPDIAPHGRATDCTGEATLAAARPSTVRYVVWCGTQVGRVAFRVGLPRGTTPFGFSHRARASGPGASGPFPCRRRGAAISCTGQTTGPITLRGTLTVAPGARCAKPVSLAVGTESGGFFGAPSGCPHSYHPRPPGLGEIERFRKENGLDRDLNGNHRAIARRARQLQRAWIDGNPVARWTAEPEVYGVPLRAQEQREMDFRESYKNQFIEVVEGWVNKHAASTYAGYGFDYEEGIIYLGFTVEPEATLEAFKRDVPLIAPEQIRPFPSPPIYTEKELIHLMETFWPSKGALSRLINSAGVDTLANKVEVRTEHVARVRKLLAERYGPDAPFEVVFARPAMFA